MTVQAGTAFKAVRGELKAAEQELAKTRERIQEIEAKPAINEKEHAELKMRLEKYEKIVAMRDVEETPDFQTKIAQPLKQAETSLAALAKKHEIAMPALQAALQETDPSKRSDLLSELSANFNRMDMQAFDAAIRDVDRLSAQREQELATAADKLAAYQKERDNEIKNAQVIFEQNWKKAKETSFAKVTAEVPAVEKTGDEKWDASIELARETVDKLDMTKVSNEELAERLYKSEILPLVLGLVADLHEKNTTLAERIQVLSGATPSIGAGDPPPPAPPGPVITEATTFKEVAQQRLEGILPR